jgi:hypothetical protein
MPIQDLPYRREDSAPRFDPADPSAIERYFDDLEFLFLKHSVSDNQEKKRAAVNYPCVVTERLWKSARAFSNPACPYEDFKAEIITLYPEAKAAHEYTRAQFDQLVSDRARTPIRSETELGEYFRKFLLISRFLISKGRLGAPEQSYALMASLGPSLSVAVRTRLQLMYPDHFLDDPYDADTIYDATRLALAWQQAALLVDAPRSVPPPVTPTLAPLEPRPTPPQSIYAPPSAPQSPPSTPSVPAIVAHAPASKSLASPTAPPRGVSPIASRPIASSNSIQPPPSSFPAFPLVPQPSSSTPSESANVRHTSTSHQPASLVVALRPVLPPSTPTPVQSESRPPPPPSFPAFLSVPQTPPSAPAKLVPIQHGSVRPQSASIVAAPRAAPPPSTSTLAPSEPRHPTPPSIHAFPPVPEAVFLAPSNPVTSQHAPQSHPSAPLVGPPRHILSPPAPTPDASDPVPLAPQPLNIFPSTPEATQSEQPDQINATLDVLVETVVSLKKGLEALLATPSRLGPCTQEPETTQTQVEQCKSGRSPEHRKEECVPAEECLRAGQRKRDAFGRLTLPAGADVPQWIRGKTLQERSDRYHKQHPGQQAAPAYLETLAHAQRPVPQEPTQAASPVRGATSRDTEAVVPACSETPRQLHHPERTMHDPPVDSNPSPVTGVSEGLEMATMSFAEILRAQTRGKVVIPEHARMHESNFVAPCAEEHHAMFSVQEVKARITVGPRIIPSAPSSISATFP